MSIKASALLVCSPLQDDFIPLAGMESFCHGRLLYPPLFVDLSPDHVTTTLSHPLQLAIFPGAALCDPKLLEGELVRNMTDDDSTIELEPDMDAVLSLLTSVDCIRDVAAVLSDSEEEEDGRGGVTPEKNWRMLLISLSLALANLQDCQMKSLSSLVQLFCWTLSPSPFPLPSPFLSLPPTSSPLSLSLSTFRPLPSSLYPSPLIPLSPHPSPSPSLSLPIPLPPHPSPSL